MATELSLEFIEKLPKTDLHVHLDGSIRVDTIIELARKQGVKLPTFDRADLFRQIFAGDVCNSLDDYLKAFDITLSVMQTEESLERTGYELAEDAWKENVRYIEVRYAPMLHTRLGLKLAPARAVNGRPGLAYLLPAYLFDLEGDWADTRAVAAVPDRYLTR